MVKFINTYFLIKSEFVLFDTKHTICRPFSSPKLQKIQNVPTKIDIFI